MLKEERQNIILNEVRIHNRVLLNDLAAQLGVSEDTVRRDLKELDTKGRVKKVHGGAISKGYHLYSYREQEIYAHEHKVRIAKKAMTLLKDGQVVLISGGTTNLELARLIPKQLKVTFFTPSLTTALQLLAHPNIETIFIGGKLSREAQIAIGGNVVNLLSQIKADICFPGTSYLDVRHGLSDFDWEVVQMKKAMISASRQTVAMGISEKLNSFNKYQVCDIEDIDFLITELDSRHELLGPYTNQGITVL